MKTLYVSILTMLLLSCQSQPVLATECSKENYATIKTITINQWQILNKAYEQGKKHNLGYTLMAIAWNESGAGKYRLNLQTHDFGVMQNNLKTAATRTNTTGHYNKMRLAEQLIKDDALSIKLALDELLYWQKNTTSWKHMISAYNNGWAYAAGSEYVDRIKPIVNMFQSCKQPKRRNMFKLDKDHQVVTDEDVGNFVKQLADESEHELVGTSTIITNRSIDESGLPAMWRRNKHQGSNT